MINKNESGVYYSKRKSDSDKYAIKRYPHQLMNENMKKKPKIVDTINKDSLGRCIPSELLLVSTDTGSRKVAVAAPDAILRQLELAEAVQANNAATGTTGNNLFYNAEDEEDEVIDDEEEDDFVTDDDYHNKDHDKISDNDNDD